jgi:hypothetical protein
MAWTTGNPVSVGNPTKKKDYDKLWDNVQHIKTNVMSSGTVMLFGQNAPPTGWTRQTAWNPGAGYTNIVYSTGQCTTGGAKAPTTDIVHTIAAHNHMWYSSGAAGGADFFDVSGNAVTLAGRTTDGPAMRIEVGPAATTGLKGDCYTNNASLTPSKTTAFRYIAVIAGIKDVY